MKSYVLALWLTFAAAASPVLADVPSPATRPEPVAATLFDPARHMRVSEVKIGMKGYGLTVFKGTKIEKFDVEVLSILKDFNPSTDVVLIKCFGPYLEHTGSIAGMSGSPIYLKDEAGRERMIGAFAYGWPLTKDPVAGVQPIEYMLQLPTDRRDETSHDTPRHRSRRRRANRLTAEHLPTFRPGGALSWSLADGGHAAVAAPASGPESTGGDAAGVNRTVTHRRRRRHAAPRAAHDAADGQRRVAAPARSKSAPSSSHTDSRPSRRADRARRLPNEPAPPLEPGSVLAVPLADRRRGYDRHRDLHRSDRRSCFRLRPSVQ